MKRHAPGIAIGVVLAGLLAASPTDAGQRAPSGGSIGINGAPCQFNTLASAIQSASPGDTILILPSTRVEFIGKIGIDLTIVPAEADCETELLSANSETVIFDANGFSNDSTGGLAEIRGGAAVTIRHMWLRNASATNGGVLAVTDGSTLTLDDVIVTDGAATENGGNIYVTSTAGNPSRLNLINDSSVYRGETTTGDGGAVALYNSELYVVDGNIGVGSNNGFSVAANDGGGVYASNSTITLDTTQSRIIWNQAGGNGGGLHAVDSVIVATGSLIGNNSAGVDGGGIWAESSTLDFNGVEISQNETSRNGAGLYLQGIGTTAEFADTTITLNETTEPGLNSGGGGIFATGTGLVSLSESFVTSNASANWGGGIVIESGADLVVSGSSVSDNTCTGFGGGILARQSSSPVELDDAVVANNVAGSSGGGLVALFTVVTARNTLFQGNSADFAGGALLLGTNAPGNVNHFINVRMLDNMTDVNGGALVLQIAHLEYSEVLTGPDACDTGALGAGGHCAQMKGNTAGDQGGAIAMYNATLSADTLWIEDNSSVTSGGGIYGIDAGLTLVDTTLHGNQTGPGGGGIHLEEGGDPQTSSLTMSGGRVSSNVATEGAANLGGGGLYLNDADASLVAVVIEDNSSFFSGGAVHGRFGSNISVVDSIVHGNSSNASGGAFYIANSNGSLLLDRAEITANIAGTSGGGVQAVFTPVSAYDTLFSGNVADQGAGAHIWFSESLFQNTRLIGNHASEEGGGVYLLESQLNILNSIGTCRTATLGIDEYCSEVRGNSAGTMGGGIYLQGSDTSPSASPRLFADGVAFIDNEALTAGAALAMHDPSPDADQDGPQAELVNVLVKGNSDATQTIEAIWLGEDGVLLLDSATIADNGGAPIRAEQDDFELTLRNSILWNNGDGPFASFDGSLSRTCSNIQTAQVGSQFFGSGVDPLFVSTSRGPLRLDPAGSPLIDLCADGPLFDLDGGVRPGRLAWDLGAFEVEPMSNDPVFTNGFEAQPP